MNKKTSTTNINDELTQQFLFDEMAVEVDGLISSGQEAEPDDLFYQLHYEPDLIGESLILNDEERVQIEPSLMESLTPTLVRASAGTGKTYQLSARYLKVLLQGARPETVLATTFTKKAAGEILDRVLGVLAEASTSQAALDDLRDQVAIPTLPQSVCLKLLILLLKNVHRLRICTMDSLFTQLARSFPFELGLPPAWRLTDEIEEDWLTNRAVDSLINQINPAETRSLLSMLGKGEFRRSIAREIRKVIDNAYTPQRGCGIEVWSKMKVPSAPESAELTRIAGHFRQAEMKQGSLVKKLNAVADLLETRDLEPLQGETLLRNIAKSNGGVVKFGNSKFPEEFNEDFGVLHAAVRTSAVALLSTQNEATGSLLQIYDHHINQLKVAVRTLGFNDIATRLSEFFKTLDAESLTHRMDGSIDHVMLDEFQDTSPVQWQVLRPLAQHTATGELDNREVPRSFFCVGDVKQAIYGWRGGVAEIFDAVEHQVAGVKPVPLDVSYRSSPVIMDVVNETFNHLPRHPMAASPDDPALKATYEAEAIRVFTQQFRDHASAKPSMLGYAVLETTRDIGKADADTKNLTHLRDVADRISEIHRDHPDASIGVLTRNNKGVAQMIYLLDQLGLDVSQEGGNPLTDSIAVELVLSALMMVEHPGDGRWKLHAASSPLADHFDFEIVGAVETKIRDMIDEIGLAETIDRLALKLAPVCDGRDTLRLKQLVQLATQYAANASPRLRDFVDMVRHKRVEKPQPAPIRVMTIHKSKGLEFDAVVLPQLDAALTRTTGGCVADAPVLGEKPVGMSRYLTNGQWHYLSTHWQQVFGKQVAGQNAEALCLLYVAMTRAKHALYMLIQPASKTEFNTKTAASLLFHALQCEGDPTEGQSELKSFGHPDWSA